MNPDGSFADTFTETAIYFIARMADGRVGYCCSAGLGRYQVSRKTGNSAKRDCYIRFSHRDKPHEEAIAALDRDMAAGRDMDIITVGYAELEKYASKGILEDLLPFLDNSARLRREDVLKPVADTYTVDGKLVALPTWFRLEVITGRQSMVGDRDGWNLPEMMAFLSVIRTVGHRRASPRRICWIYV